jgi:hypothetical protein
MNRYKAGAWTAAAAAVLLAGAAIGQPAGPASTTGGGAAEAGLGFGLHTVVAHFRPGFEPDTQVDRHTGQTYSSEPFGFSATQSFVWRSDDDRRSFHLTEGDVLGKDHLRWQRRHRAQGRPREQ